MLKACIASKWWQSKFILKNPWRTVPYEESFQLQNYSGDYHCVLWLLVYAPRYLLLASSDGLAYSFDLNWHSFSLTIVFSYAPAFLKAKNGFCCCYYRDKIFHPLHTENQSVSRCRRKQKHMKCISKLRFGDKFHWQHTFYCICTSLVSEHLFQMQFKDLVKNDQVLSRRFKPEGLIRRLYCMVIEMGNAQTS